MSECMLPDFYDYTEPIARKQHKCCECSAPILKGERHFSYRGVWEGSFDTGRQHLVCMEACMWIRNKMNGGECIGFGELWETWGEMGYQCDKSKEPWKTLRSLLAKILLRERASGRITAP